MEWTNNLIKYNFYGFFHMERQMVKMGNKLRYVVRLKAKAVDTDTHKHTRSNIEIELAKNQPLNWK